MWPGPYGDHGSRKYLLASLDQSLRRLGLDYVDIFHSPGSTRKPRWKKRWGRWTPRSGPDAPATPESRRTRRRRPPKRRGSCANSVPRDSRLTSVVLGASSIAQLEANVGALDNLDFTGEELAEIETGAY